MGVRKWWILGGVLGIVVVVYGLVGIPKIKVRPSGDEVRVRVVGKSVIKIIKEAKATGGSGVGVQGGDLCRHTPEYIEISKKKGDEGWSEEEWNRLSDDEKLLYLGECLPPEGYPELENITVELSAGQIVDLVRQFMPDTVKLRDIGLEVRDGIIWASAKSGYPPFAGSVTVEAVANSETNWYRIRRAWLGQISLPEQLVRQIDDGLDSIITNTLADFYVSIEQGKLDGEKFVLAVEAPKGLVTMDGGTIVVNFEVLKSLPIRPKTPGDMEIMPVIQ